MSQWTESVSYVQFVRDSYDYLSDNFAQVRLHYRFPQQFLSDAEACLRNNRDPYFFLYIALLTLFWTVLRSLFANFFSKPLSEYFQLPKDEQEKLPESLWKFFYYSCSWSLAAYILLVKEKGQPLINPPSIFQDWKFTNSLPFEYQLLFIGQLSFYLHSFYATVVMDRWRKDSMVLIAHHLITVLLIFFTFSTRCHKAATITFFLHDICDILLEGTKSSLYFKLQGDKEKPIFEWIANVGFGLFSITWFVLRLYVFPLRLVWVCSAYLTQHAMHVPLMFMLNSLLFILLTMNIYWFTFILKLLYKVATGNEELEDSREYEEKKPVLNKSDIQLVQNATEQQTLSESDLNEKDVNAKDNPEQISPRVSNYLLRKRSDGGGRSK